MKRLALGVVLACTVVCACGPKTMQTRLKESESRAGQADDALTAGEKALAALDPDGAQKQFEKAQKLLADPDAQLYPEYELMKGRLEEGLAGVPACRVAKVRTKVTAASDKARKASDAVLSTKVSEAAIKDGHKALEELKDALDDGKELEAKDAEYGAYTKEQRAWIDGFEPQLKTAAAKLEFMAGPLVASNEGNEKLRAAKKAKPVEERRELYTAARDRLQECSDKGKALIAKTPTLAAAAVSSDGAVASIEGVLSDCSTGVKAADKALKALPKPKPPPPPPPPPKAQKGKKK